MKHFFRGGEGLSCGQSDRVNMLTSYHVLSSCPININDRLLSRSKFGTGLPTFRSDEMERNDEDKGSLRTTFGLASPLLRPYITDSSPFQYLFNTSESRIVDEKVIERCSGGNETPKLVRSRYEDDPGLVQTPMAYLPPFARYFIASEAKDRQTIGKEQATDRQRTGKEQATDRQRTGKEKANKYQAKPKPSLEKEQGMGSEPSGDGLSNRLLLSLGRYSRRIGTQRRYEMGSGSENATFQKGAQTKVELGSRQPKTRVELGMNYQRTKNELASIHNPSKSFIILQNHSQCGKGSILPLNLLCAFSEPKTPMKGTGNKHKRYMPDTCLTPIQDNNDTCLTHQPHKNDTIKCSSKDCFTVVPPIRNDASGTCNDGEVECAISFDSSAFKKHCGSQIAKDVSLCAKRKTRAQRGLKRVKQIVDSKWLMARGLVAQDKLGSVQAQPFARLGSTKTRSIHGRYSMGTRSPYCIHRVATVRSSSKGGSRAGLGRVQQYLDIKRPMAYSLQLITLFCVLFSTLAFTQAVAQVQSGSVLVGEVHSAANGAVIDGATVTDSKKTVHTDAKGRFSIAVDKQHGVLVIKYIGYKEQRVAYDKNATLIRVNLEVDQTQIEEVEVVSTGFFSVPKERATGSFTHVNNELLSRSVGSNVIDRLKDVVPGITFNQTKIGKSNFYKEPSISIRGRSTIRGNAEPLVILDNFPYEGKIEDINPEDIESVTILQDAAAASIWGARAGNGVIVLTSKQGHREQPMQVNWRSDYSISAKPDLYYAPIIPMDEFIEVERFLFNKNAWNPYINQGYSYITPAIELLKQHRDNKLTDMELEEALDVLKGQDVRRDLEKYFYCPSSLRKTFLSFNGGGKRNTYYFSAGYDQNVSDKVGADNQRISINMRNSYELWRDKLKLDVGLLFAKALDRSSRNTSVGYNVLYDRLVDEAGNPLSIGGGNKFRQSYIDTAGNGLLKDWNYRPVEEIGLNPARTSGLSYQLSTGFEYKALDWLTLSGKYQYGSGTSEINWLWDAESFQMRNLYNQFTRINHAAGTATSAIPEGGQFNVTQSTFSNHNGRIQLAVHKDWNVHQFSMIMGGELNKRQTFRNVQETMLGYQPATETYTPMDLTARYPQYHVTSLGGLLVSPTQNQRETTDNRNVLMFGNASYSYDRRYTATFSVRKDRANIFGVEANKKGKPFMSAGVLWNLHEESFVQFPWLQKLSLRGTVGTMGNVSTASAYLTSQVGGSVNSDNGRKFQSIVTAPNPLLSWEKVRMLNLAMDFSLLNSKLSGTIERYYRTSTDLLSYNPMNPSSGISTLYGNWSAMKSSGWDISVNSRLRYSDFSWTGNLVFSHIKDRVTDYYEKPTSDVLYLTSSIGEYPIEGKPLNTIYSLPYAGLDNKGDPMGYLDGELSTDYANIYSNTPLSEYIYHGRATPSTFGSLRNSFAYKGVELSFMLSYHLGYYFRQKAFSSSSLYSLTGYGSAVFQSDYTQRWQQAGDETTTRVPAAIYPVNGNREVFYGLTEDHVQRGDHIRFRDIRLSYSFPGLKNGLIRNLQVYGYVDNVGLLWAANDNGFDPLAIPDAGLKYPVPRTYALGLNLKF